MTCRVPRTILTFVALLTTMAVPAWPQARLDKIKSDYQAVSFQLEKHIVHDWWIDDDPRSPELLARRVVASRRVGPQPRPRTAHPSAGAEELDAALSRPLRPHRGTRWAPYPDKRCFSHHSARSSLPQRFHRRQIERSLSPSHGAPHRPRRPAVSKQRYWLPGAQRMRKKAVAALIGLHPSRGTGDSPPWSTLYRREGPCPFLH